ncbi:MAG TPA: type II toxin-antitoxin system HicB family antitoxin [Candidatus Nanoarchaeia archaeon]|nr:type II toxin-antitoxin system HicB family antitoxin [Candidatus Nanoarchaeia archaeon]
MLSKKYRVVMNRDEDGIYVVECPSLPSCISQGKTKNEALKNIKEAIEGYLESLRKHNEKIPPQEEEFVVEVSV